MAKETERLSRKSVAQSRPRRLTTGPLVHDQAVKRLLGHGHGGHGGHGGQGGQDSAVRSAEAIADELRNASQRLFFRF